MEHSVKDALRVASKENSLKTFAEGLSERGLGFELDLSLRGCNRG